MSWKYVTALVVAWVLTLASQDARAISVAEFSFGAPSYGPGQATVDVMLNFTSEENTDVINGIALSVHDSDLTSGNTDFSRFSFAPGASLAGWLALGDSLTVDGVETYLEFGGGTPLTPGSYTIGQIAIDLAGLADGSVHNITLAGGDFNLATNTDVFGDITVNGQPQVAVVFGLDEGQTDAAFVTFGNNLVLTVPPGSGNVIPEPATAMLGLISLTGLALAARRRR